MPGRREWCFYYKGPLGAGTGASSSPLPQLLAEENKRWHFGSSETSFVGGTLRGAEHPVLGRTQIKAPCRVPALRSA